VEGRLGELLAMAELAHGEPACRISLEYFTPKRFLRRVSLLLRHRSLSWVGKVRSLTIQRPNKKMRIAERSQVIGPLRDLIVRIECG
jgi:hypothetical protein